ncbi:hypothetical protein J437_LFUL012957 [Ladona fulva]|uniref:Reticulon-like protein n=1 Tax=Ladona fulva TaxID=123851 RepID=A0A8K0P3R9_LADFU|nr:hypothetical protein J437_LFUL012957 [Ladona fulva]
MESIINAITGFKKEDLVQLVYWRNPKESGAVFGSVLAILLSLSYFSLISVVAYLSLCVLCVTLSIRVYKSVLQAIQKNQDGHPFKDLLEMDLTMSEERVQEVTRNVVAHTNAAVTELRRLFLVEDLVDSLKFGVCLWCLTYIFWDTIMVMHIEILIYRKFPVCVSLRDFIQNWTNIALGNDVFVIEHPVIL